MCETIPASDFDTVGSLIDEMIDETYQIYTPEKEAEWGAVAITIELLNNAYCSNGTG
nr:hypothetical protein [Paraliobacillus ryukyuensis]